MNKINIFGDMLYALISRKIYTLFSTFAAIKAPNRYKILCANIYMAIRL